MDGTRLKRIMKAKGLSGNDVAEKLGMTSQNLSQLLSKDDIKTNFLERFCEAVGITPAEVYGGTANVSDHLTVIAGSGNVAGDCGMLEKAMEQNAVLLEQNSRLLGIIEKMNK